MAVRLFTRVASSLLLAATAALSLAGGAVHADSASAAEVIEGEVFLSPTCGCCKAWVAHMQENGFDLDVKLRDEMQPVKAELGVPAPMRSCHTAVIDGYVIEGHVPASDVRRLLEERPEATGIATPGMPIGSPGMEYKDETEPYDVMLFGEGVADVFEHHE